MSSNGSSMGSVTNIYVARFGEDGKWAAMSLAEGLLRFNWDHLTFDEVTSAPRDAIRARLLATAKSPGEATNDSGRLETLRSSRSEDLWIAFENDAMWWTRLVDGPIERDETSTFRRTTGWSNRSLGGEPLDFSRISEQVRAVNRTSPSAVNHVVQEDRQRAVLTAIQDDEALRIVSAAPKVAAQLTDQQRAELRSLWNKLRHIGPVGDISKAGHGVDLSSGSGKTSWRASMYWSNSKSGNAVSFCIHAGRLFVGDKERGDFQAWFAEQRRLLEGRDAESRSSEERVQSALRVGFDYEGGLTFLRRFVEALDPMRPNPNTRWRLTDDTGGPADLEITADSTQFKLEPQPTELPGVDPLAMSIEAMVGNAHGAAAESGAVRERVAKLKEVRMSRDELAVYIRELVERQGRRCKLSGLPLHFRSKSDDEVDSERLASLDRIDPDGHYERGNLQVVCWFLNRWKGDDTNENFARLLELLATPRIDLEADTNVRPA
jgi:hypothetical protein